MHICIFKDRTHYSRTLTEKPKKKYPYKSNTEKNEWRNQSDSDITYWKHWQIQSVGLKMTIVFIFFFVNQKFPNLLWWQTTQNASIIAVVLATALLYSSALDQLAASALVLAFSHLNSLVSALRFWPHFHYLWSFATSTYPVFQYTSELSFPSRLNSTWKGKFNDYVLTLSWYTNHIFSLISRRYCFMTQIKIDG